MATNAKQKRNRLREKGEQLKASLKEDIEGVKERSKDIARHGLIIAGVFVGGVVLYKLLSATTDEEVSSPDESRVVVIREPSHSILKSVMTSIAIFLLNIAKDKLLEYLEKQETDNAGEK